MGALVFILSTVLGSICVVFFHHQSTALMYTSFRRPPNHVYVSLRSRHHSHLKVSPCAWTALATLNHFYSLPAYNTLLRCRRHSMGLGGRRCRRGAVWRRGCDRVSSRFCCTGRWRCSSRFRTHMVAKTRRFLLPTIWLLLVMLLLLVCGFCWSYLCCFGFGL